MDILKVLDAMLAITPEDSYLCPPFKRAQVVAAADEIRRLRELLATPDGHGKTHTVAELLAILDTAQTRTDAQDLENRR